MLYYDAWGEVREWTVWLTQQLLDFLKHSRCVVDVFWMLLRRLLEEQMAFCSIDWNKQTGILRLVSLKTADKNLSILAFVCLPKFRLWHSTMCWLFVLQSTQKRVKEPFSLGCRQWETNFSCSIHPRNKQRMSEDSLSACPAKLTILEYLDNEGMYDGRDE